MVTADFVADEPEVPAAAEELAPDTGPPAAPASTPGVPIAVDPEARAPPATPAPPPVTSDDAPTEPPLFPATAGPPRAAASRSAPERRDPHAATAQRAKTSAVIDSGWARSRRGRACHPAASTVMSPLWPGCLVTITAISPYGSYELRLGRGATCVKVSR